MFVDGRVVVPAHQADLHRVRVGSRTLLQVVIVEPITWLLNGQVLTISSIFECRNLDCVLGGGILCSLSRGMHLGLCGNLWLLLALLDITFIVYNAKMIAFRKLRCLI